MAQELPEELPRNRFWIKCAVILVLLAAFAAAGWLLYRRYEPIRLTNQAREFLAKEDYGSAVLTARRALQINPSSEPASRVMAEITEKMQIPETVEWRQRVAELKPGSSAEALDWAAAALRAGRPAASEQALAAVPEAEKGSARYHSLAGTSALATGRVQAAGKHFHEAVRLEPENALYQYNLATYQIQSSDSRVRAEGAATLERLAKDGRVDVFAQRSLISQHVQAREPRKALEVSTALMQSEAANFRDRLRHLDLLASVQGSEAVEQPLTALQARALQEQPEDVAALLHWMREHGRAEAALAWAATLPAPFATHPRVGEERAETFIDRKDWSGLREFLEGQEWDASEYLRLAYLARALREQGDADGARARWTAALSAARGREPLSKLAFLAAQWKWTEELRDTLWSAASAPAPQWALQMLHRSYLADGDTTALLRVAQKAADVEPDSKTAQNNVAMLSVLLGRNLGDALSTAKSLHEAEPENAGFASTYAMALHANGQTDAGLAVLKKLPAEQLREPAIAAYYGVLLAASGAKEEAREYLALGKDALLLPEERALLTSAGVAP